MRRDESGWGLVRDVAEKRGRASSSTTTVPQLGRKTNKATIRSGEQTSQSEKDDFQSQGESAGITAIIVLCFRSAETNKVHWVAVISHFLHRLKKTCLDPLTIGI